MSKSKKIKIVRPLPSGATRRPKKVIALSRKTAWHIRLSLHPASLMVALCVGVLLIASSIGAFGDVYTVTATVPTFLPTSAAVITSPNDGDSFTDPDVTIAGTCPSDSAPGSYVTLDLNGVYTGDSPCPSGTFSIATTLLSGANIVHIQDYNVTNQAGPTSSDITINYTPPPAPILPPAPTTQDTSPAAPENLDVMQVDNNVSYVSTTVIQTTTDLPTFTGSAPPYAQVTLMVHSVVVMCYTQADGNGFWSCTLPTELPPGIHSVLVSAVTTAGHHLSLPLFHIQVLSAKPQPTIVVPSKPVVLSQQPYQYQAYVPGQSVPLNLVINNGTGPYTITINWGDGTRISTEQAASGALSLSHHYKAANQALTSYTVIAQVIDSHGVTYTTQSTIFIRNNNYHAPVARSSTHTPRSSGLHSFLTSVHSFLWILWPGYIIIVLMLISFWLGERRQKEDDNKRKVRKATTTRRHRKKHA